MWESRYSCAKIACFYAVVVGYAVLFFFSSRRRHTRFDCDWSSDVCSSDLFPLALPADELGPVVLHHGEAGPARRGRHGRHGRKIGRKEGPIKPRNPLSHLTKGDFAG